MSNVTSPPYLFSSVNECGNYISTFGSMGYGCAWICMDSTNGWMGAFQISPLNPPSSPSSSVLWHFSPLPYCHFPMALLPSCHFPTWFSQTAHRALQGQRALTGPAYMIVGVWIYNDTGSGHESMMGGVRRGYTFPQLFFTSSRIRDCQTINHKMTAALSLQLQHFLSDCLVFIYSCRQELTVL